MKEVWSDVLLLLVAPLVVGSVVCCTAFALSFRYSDGIWIGLIAGVIVAGAVSAVAVLALGLSRELRQTRLAIKAGRREMSRSLAEIAAHMQVLREIEANVENVRRPYGESIRMFEPDVPHSPRRDREHHFSVIDGGRE